jgi:hypothetical protein
MLVYRKFNVERNAEDLDALPTIDWLIDCFIQAIHGDRMSRPYIGT